MEGGLLETVPKSIHGAHERMARKPRLPIRVIYRESPELSAPPTAGGRRKPRRRWHRHPVVVLVLSALVASFCGIVVHPRAFVLAALALAIALLGLVLPWLSLRGVRGSMVYLRRRGQVGKEYSLRVRFRNGWFWPVYGLVVRGGWTGDATSVSDDAATLVVTQLPARRETEVTWSVVPRRRGIYPVREATVASGFPFGFYEARRRMKDSGQLLVWPAVIPLPRLQEMSGRMVLGEVVDGRRAGTAGELSGSRPYQRGESLRRIHWAQTARHDQLIVCERSDPAAQGLQVILETSRDVFSMADGSDWEAAVSIVASVTAVLVEEGGRASVVLGVGKVHEIDNPASLTPVFDLLARLQPGDDVSLGGLLRLPVCRPLDGTPQLVITTPAGFARLEPDQVNRPARRFFLVEGPQSAGSQGSGRRWPGKPGVHIIPVDDPGHEQLRKAWEDLAHGS